jgi:uncharacterized membrane protein
MWIFLFLIEAFLTLHVSEIKDESINKSRSINIEEKRRARGERKVDKHEYLTHGVNTIPSL